MADLPLVIQADAERRLQSCLTGEGPILLGETRGAAENPLVILTLMHRFGVRVLALEWPPELEPAVQRYLEGDVVDFRMLEGSSDGRITAGHMAVLRELHDEGSLEQLVLFDAPPPIAGVVADRGHVFRATKEGWTGRDQLMAERLLTGINGAAPALVVAGSLHTRLRPHRHGVPLGYHVAQARPSTLEVRIEYLNGEVLNVGRSTIGAGSLIRRPWPSAEPVLRITADHLVFTLPKVRAAVVPDPRRPLR